MSIENTSMMEIAQDGDLYELDCAQVDAVSGGFLFLGGVAAVAALVEGVYAVAHLF